MAITDWSASFQTSVPDGASDLVSDLDDAIHETKEQVSIRLENGGHLMTDDPNTSGHTYSGGSDSSKDGRHVVEGGTGGASPDIYQSDGTTAVVEYTDSGMDVTGTITGTNVTSGNNPGHLHDTTAMFTIPTVAAGVVPGLYFENRGDGDITLLEARLIAGTPPSGGTLTLAMGNQTSGWTNPTLAIGSGSAAVFVTPPALADGEYRQATPTTGAAISDAQLQEGELWIFEIDENSGNADDIVLLLKLRRG